MPSRVATPLWLGVALMLVALNLRPAITAVPPLLDDVRRDLALSAGATGLLTTLPVLCFAVFGLFAPALARRVGGELVLLATLGVMAGGILVRLLPGVAPLFAGTFVLGVGIAIANVLVPALVKRDYPRPGAAMGAYTMALNLGAGMGAGLAVPTERLLGGSWRGALALCAVPVAVAAAAWVPVTLRARRNGIDEAARPSASLLRDRVAWLLTAFMALQSMLFFSAIAWIPDIVRDAGLSSGSAGLMLALMTLLGLPAALVVPVLAARRDDQRGLVVATSVLWLLALVGLLLAPGEATAVWMLLLGLGQGAGIALALTLIVVRSPNGEVAAALSAMVQCVGYLLAAVGPVLLGVAHDLTGGWEVPIALMIAMLGGFLVFGLGVARPGFAGVEERAPY